MNSILLAIFFLVTCSVCLADESFELNFWDDAYKIETVPASLSSQYYGVFSNVMDFTGGKRIYLFPDGSFVISHSCDICQNEIESFGKFSIVESELRLSFESNVAKDSERYFVRFGSYQTSGKILHPIKLIFTAQQLLAAKKNPDNFDFFLQKSQFHDWESIQHSLRNNHTNQALNRTP